MQKSKIAVFTLLFSFLLVSAGFPAFCQSALSDPGAKRMCDAVKDVQLPAKDQPTTDEKKSLQNCSSEDLYYGFDKPPDFVKARKCAYLEMEQGKDDLDLAGRATLMMVYANGKGADRNLDIALKLACEMKGGPGDVAGNIYELERLKKYPPSAKFSVCDHSASRHLYESCAILGDKFDRLERAKEIDAFSSSLTKKQQEAFSHLDEAAEAFFKSRASSEIDLRPTFQVQEMAFMENEFIKKLQQLQHGQLPSFSATDLHKAQADLDKAYADTQKDPKRQWGTATVEGVRKTQQVWLAYRNAWVNFGKVTYPNVNADAWRTWISEDRYAELEKLLP
ncbi:MAG TPA: hypothetical protein VFP59_13895 [Candidatus Angelobacter sp.]|nr:hypothetical protein [Candidatus Angelobacter sp.]